MEQQTEVPVRGLMGISMADSGNGYAVGDVDVVQNRSGVLVKRAGDPTWRLVPPGAFTPAINVGLASWAQDVYAVPKTSIAYISWRDDYRSLVYKTVDYGASWFSVSPLNPMLYGTRFRLRFKDERVGMIVGEGPGRVHVTDDGGRTWTNYTLPVAAPLTDISYASPYWWVAGGENALFRFDPARQRWDYFSFQNTVDSFMHHTRVQFLNTSTGYYGGYNSAGPEHLLQTTDGGLSWHPTPTQPGFAGNSDGFRGLWFFSVKKGWVASGVNELAYTSNGGQFWNRHQPQLLGGKNYLQINRIFFNNEADGWAVGGRQRDNNYLSLSDGYILRWIGTDLPDISTSTTRVDFDTVSCTAYVEDTLQITNSGMGSLIIEPEGITFNVPGMLVTDPPFPLVLNAGQTQPVTLRWTPDTTFKGALPDSAVMRIESNDLAHPYWMISLKGFRVVSRLNVPRTTIILPLTCKNDSTHVTVPVTATGNSAPVLVSYFNEGPDADLFLLHPQPGESFMPLDTLRFIVRPRQAGQVGGALQLTVGNPACPELLTIQYSIAVSSNNMSASPAIVQFGDVCAGESTVQFVQVTNRGSREGRITGWEVVEGPNVFSLAYDSLPVPRGATKLVAVRFSPLASDAAQLTGRLRLLLGPCPDTLELTVEGRGVGAQFSVVPAAGLDIGPVPLGKPVTRTITLRNDGFQQARLAATTLQPPIPGLRVIPADTLPVRVNPGASTLLNVEYTAPTSDSAVTQLCVLWDQPCRDTLCIPVRVRGDRLPAIAVASAWTLALQGCDTPVDDSLRVDNIGQDTLVLTRFEVTGADALHFRFMGPIPPVRVAPGTSVYLRFRYDSPVNGRSGAELRIRHNDMSENGVTLVLLSGERRTEDLTLFGDTLSAMRACPGMEARRNMTLFNPTTAPRTIQSIDVLSGAHFSVRHAALPSVVQPLGSFSFEVVYAPDTAGSESAQLGYRSLPCDVRTTFPMQGATLGGAIRFVPDPLQLGLRAAADTSRFDIVLVNGDSVAVLIDSLSLKSLAGVAVLTAVPPRRTWLAAGDSLTVQIQLLEFKPVGRISGYLCVHSLAPCADEQCLFVGGRVIDDAVSVVNDTARYLFEPCDAQRCDTVRVANMLGVPQTLSAAAVDPLVFQVVSPAGEVEVPPGDTLDIVVCAVRAFSDRSAGRLTVFSQGRATATAALLAEEDSLLLELPDTLDMNNLASCETRRDETLILRNPGPRPLTLVAAPPPAAPFSVAAALPQSIAPGDSAGVAVSFVPTAPGRYAVPFRVTVRGERCERTWEVTLTGARDDAFYAVSPSTLLFPGVPTGASQIRAVQFTNRDIRGLHLASATATPAPQFQALNVQPGDVGIGATIPVSVQFAPLVTGSTFGTLRLIFDRPCADTVEIGLEGVGVEGGLVFTAPRLQFDTLAWCETADLVAELRNASGATVHLQRTDLIGPAAAAFTVLDPVVPAEPLDAGASRLFHVRFTAGNAAPGLAQASLVVVSDLTGPPPEMPLEGVRADVPAPADQVITLRETVIVGDTLRMDVRVDNPAARDVVFTRLNLPAEYAVLPSAPVTVPARDSVTLRLAFAPTAARPVDDTLRLHVDAPCADTTRIVVRGRAVDALTLAAMDFGMVPFCEQPERVTVLGSGLRDDAQVTRIAVEGADAARFRVIDPVLFPVGLGAGGALPVRVSCVPDPSDLRAYDAELVVDAVAPGRVLQVRAPLHALAFDGGLSLPPVVDFGPVPTGVWSAERVVVGRNLSAAVLHVDRIVRPSPRYEIVRALPAPPADIAPGDSLVLHMRFRPDRPGVIEDSAEFEYTLPCPTALPLRVRGTGVGDLVPCVISASSAAGAPDDTIAVDLYSDIALAGLGVTAWSGSFSYNRTMLYPLRVETRGTVSEDAAAVMNADRLNGVVALDVQGAPMRDGTGSIARVYFLVLVGDALECALQPAMDFRFSNPILVQNGASPGLFRLEGYCRAGDRLVRLRGDGFLGQNAPNPCAHSTAIRFGLPVAGVARLTVFDESGRAVARPVDGALAAGEHEVRVDVRDWPAGVYLYRLEAEGLAETRRLVVIP